MLDKAKEIIEGWDAYAEIIKSQDEANKQTAMERANICALCPFAEKSKVISWLMPDNNLKQVQGYKCSKCGCPLSTKVRSMTSKCPENKWRQKE